MFFALMAMLVSCHNANKDSQAGLTDIAAINNLNDKDSAAFIDSIMPPKDIDSQEVLLDTLLSRVRCKLFFNKDSGEVYLFFKDSESEMLFPLDLFIGAMRIPEPPYIREFAKINDSSIGVKIIMGRTEMGADIDELSYYELSLKSKKLVPLFDIPDIGTLVDDSLCQVLLDKAADSDYTQYDYQIDFSKRKVTVQEYEPFKPVSEKYKKIMREYKLKYKIKTIVDSW
jgi:hypothetical protein